MHALFANKCPLQYCIQEGSLKSSILSTGLFSKEELHFFQETKEGKLKLCQLAEFFMNAFKFGEKAIIGDNCLLSDHYIVPLSPDLPSFQPTGQNTILYPPLYQALYSPTGAFAETLSTLFSVKGRVHDNSVTVWNVQKKSEVEYV